MSIISKTHPEIGWLVNFESSVLRGPVKLSTGPSSSSKKIISKFLGESNFQVERHIFAFSGQYPPSTGFLWFCIFPNFFETRLDVCLLCAQRALLMKICKSVRENPWWFNYSKVLLTSPAHGVHVFRSAKRTLSLSQLGHHICLLPSFHDSCFFLPAAAAAQLSRRKWTALGQRLDVHRLAGRTFARGEGRPLDPTVSEVRARGLQTLLSQLWVWLNASLLCTFPAALG